MYKIIFNLSNNVIYVYFHLKNTLKIKLKTRVNLVECKKLMFLNFIIFFSLYFLLYQTIYVQNKLNVNILMYEDGVCDTIE